jgi:hypothetical protein
MATSPQGIMALPQEAQQAAPQLSIDDSYDAVRGGLSDASPESSAQVQEALNQLLPALDEISDQDLDKLIQIVQYMHDHEEEYASAVSQLVQAGIVDDSVFPPEYDPEFIATLGMVLLEAKRQRMQAAPEQAMPQPPMQLAAGGIAEATRMLAGKGRMGDTMLAHINEDEARLLKRHGGSGTINPETGLPEFFNLGQEISNLGKSSVSFAKNPLGTISKGVKTITSSPVGRILATAALAAFLGPAAMSVYGVAGAGLSTAASIGLASGAITALGGGSLKDVLRSGAQGYFVGAVAGPAGSSMGAATGVTNAAAQAAMGAGAAGTAIGVLSGKGLKASLTEGLKSAAVAGLVTGGAKGFSAQNPATPGQGPLTTEQVNQQISEMAKGEAGNNVSGKFNPATGRFEVPVSDAGTAAVNARGSEALNNYAGSNANPDPLGQFIAQNDALRQNVGNAPMGMTPPVGAPPTDPSMFDQVKDIYKNNFSPSGIRAQGAVTAQADALKQYNIDLANKVPPDIARANYTSNVAANMPGTISTYGPMVGAGLGITALAGGFKPKTVTPSGTVDMSGKATQDIINANPSRYITQGLPGVSYDASGNITGSTAGWNPRSGVGTTEVSSGYMPYSPSQYQPYNFMPRYAADGGYMQSSPAFPGTPLTSSRMPMPMGQQPAGILPMNTPGLPMNMSNAPMNLPVAGYAMGGAPVMGIASLGTGGYPRRNGQISGPGTETSDSIPAMLSDGEFVMTAKAVKALGKGNRRAGAKKMYALMHHLEKNAARG